MWPHVNHDYTHFRESVLAALRDAWLPAAGQRDAEFAVRLALAHPAKAGEALGPGWITGEYGFSFELPANTSVWDTPLTVLAQNGGVVIFPPTQEDSVVPVARWFDVPPEFDAALARARLIAAAWQRIEATR